MTTIIIIIITISQNIDTKINFKNPFSNSSIAVLDGSRVISAAFINSNTIIIYYHVTGY